MAGPLIPVAAAIVSFIAKKGINAAIKKYGAKAVKEAQKKQISKLEDKAAKSRQATRETAKKEREKLDPGFSAESESIFDKISSVSRMLKEAKQAGDTKAISRLEARLRNLREIKNDRPDTVIHKGTGGRFSRGGLIRNGNTDYRKKGLFN